MCMSSPKVPNVKPPEQEAKVEQAVSDAQSAERRRQRQTSGVTSTLLTGGPGVTSVPSLGTKTLLGV